VGRSPERAETPLARALVLARAPVLASRSRVSSARDAPG
jgi:hypothetical protein